MDDSLPERALPASAGRAADAALDAYADQHFPRLQVRADELLIADDVFLPIPKRGGGPYEMSGHWGWFTVYALRGGLTVADADGIEHPAILADVYRWAVHRDVVLIAHHVVGVRRPREAGPGAEQVRIRIPEGIIKMDGVFLPKSAERG